ncbi:unnamed protein product [Dibothriocephalus latus]|uniref:Uncharacterized protein n=1 Tax=Dibothriocephalus latus TaxID=60516 RepID=A0A3P7QY23_DIBLA|nr:unnamed protein product [Dibothriocephalus latus]
MTPKLRKSSKIFVKPNCTKAFRAAQNKEVDRCLIEPYGRISKICDVDPFFDVQHNAKIRAVNFVAGEMEASDAINDEKATDAVARGSSKSSKRTGK